MSNLINTYPVFESSQVLTSSQLNQVVSYLDQQSRLTRVKLIGMGIVCGLELTYEETGADTQIIISKGTAITSEGFLVTLGHCDTSWYRPYTLPDGVTYKPFEEPSEDIILYELLKDLPEDTADVEELDNSDGFLDDKFVLLFLETFDNDLKSCLGNTCDELGIDRVFTLRKLLISKDHLDLVLQHSANVGQQYPEYPDKYELPDIVMPRTLFDPDDSHSEDYTAFSEHYASTFVDSVYPALFGDDSNPGALSETYSVYNALLGPEYNFNNPFETTSVGDLKSAWSDFLDGSASPGPAYRGIQYFADFLKDLILAYDEFRETAFDLMAECCPDMSLFPKHVMLGRAVVPNETPEEAHTYRHGFTQPPIYNHQKQLIEKTFALHKRMVLMVETFNLDRINNPDIAGEAPQQLRITPSDEKNTPLSERSIPYYYDSKEEVSIVGAGDLEHYWNFDITRKKLPGTTELVLSYENQSEDQSTIASPLETPLYYDLDSYPFLRIEGHIGYGHDEVIDLINTMKATFDLPFDTVALQLDTDASLLELDYSCGFEDLQEEYTIARNTYCGFIRDLTGLFEFALEHQDTIFDDSDETSEDLDRVQEILESLEKLCELMTDCLHEFDFVAFQQSYKTALQLILDFVLVEKELLNEINVDEEDAEEELPIINGMIQRLSPVLFRFVDLLFYNTFLRVYYGFKRREYYLQRETALFSRYIRQHPGVQHQAGVPKGGTFIVVYNSSEDQAVIADFNLPYFCCGTDRCVPMCNEEDSDFVFDITPFARPDYAITTIGTPVEIDVSLNDYEFWNAEFSVESDEDSANAGSIEQLSEEGLLEYSPPEADEDGNEFAGYDTFQYSIGNRETGAEDRGTVTVLVKGREVEAGCYSIEILNCWGRELVQVALRNRDIDTSDMSPDQMVETLLESLRESGGFTQDEIRSNPLESEELRRQLLTCLEIPHNDNTTYQQLEQLIVDYQNENCGGGVVIEATTVELSTSEISVNELRAVLSSRGREVSEETELGELESEIRNTEGGMRFSREEIMLFTRDRITQILRRRNLNVPSSANKSQLIDILFRQQG